MKLSYRRARHGDLAYLHRIEHDPKNAPYINPWPRRRHVEAMKSPDCLHMIVEAGGRRVGFFFLRGLKDREGTVEFKRIVIDFKGKGYGREAVKKLQELAFGRFKAHRLWLHVKGFNLRAKKLYDSLGFKTEGEMRECVRHRGRFHSLFVMGMLRREYRRALR